MCKKLPRLCSLCSNYKPTFSTFMIHHRNFDNSNTTGTTSRAGTPSLPDHPSAPPVLNGVRAAQCLVFCVVFCRSLFIFFPFSLAIFPSVLHRFIVSDYSFGIFKLFLMSVIRQMAKTHKTPQQRHYLFGKESYISTMYIHV